MTDDLDKLEGIDMKSEQLDLLERSACALRDGFGPQSLTCSPDVVLALIARVRTAEAATKYLYDAWEDAEGQASLYVFGSDDADLDAIIEAQGGTVHKASPEIQALVRRVCK